MCLRRSVSAAITLCLLLTAVHAFGSVYTVKLASDAENSASDVYEHSLHDGSSILLVDHELLPKQFMGCIEAVQALPDAKQLVLLESEKVTIQAGNDGASRVSFGSSYSLINNEKVTAHTYGGCWIWSRTAKRATRLVAATEHDCINNVAWSPDGKLLCVSVTTGSHDAVTIYESLHFKVVKKVSLPAESKCRWNANSKSITAVCQPKDSLWSVLTILVSGKPSTVITTKRLIVAAASSPDGSQIAYGGRSGISVYNPSTKTHRTISLATSLGLSDAMLMYAPKGHQLAVMMQTTSSGVYAEVVEQLWVVDTASLKMKRIARWETTLGNSPGEDSTHALLGWSKDGSLMVEGISCTISGADTEWRKLWQIPATGEPKARLLVDSGQRGISLCWCE